MMGFWACARLLALTWEDILGERKWLGIILGLMGTFVRAYCGCLVHGVASAVVPADFGSKSPT